MAKLFNRVGMTVSGAPGTGNATLNAAITAPKKYNSFSGAGVANGDIVTYLIEDGPEFELGIGTHNSGVLTRTTVITSSNGGAKINASSAALVYIDASAQDVQPSGAVIQVVNTITGALATGTTILPIDDSIPQKTEGDQYMSLSITPTNASNLLKIDVVWTGTSSGGAGGFLAVALFQDSTANALAAVGAAAASTTAPGVASFSHFMVAGTTSPTTFKVRAGQGAAGTTTFNGASGARRFGGVMASSITITEIRA